tara:strand:- start:361 stop:489 length:129 start_codon:yes stop_codon:yes gene_type:complete
MSKFNKVLNRANQVAFTLVQVGMYVMMAWVGVIIVKTIIAIV